MLPKGVKVAKPRVYIETTVISYLASKPSRDLVVAAHQQVTAEWWETVLPKLEPFVSPIVIEEVGRGDKEAAARRLSRIETFGILEVTGEVRDLAESYFGQIEIPEKARADAFHLALAAFHGMDLLVSWNFSHILAPRMRAVIEELNRERGIATPVRPL